MDLINFNVLVFPLGFRVFPLIIVKIDINSIEGMVNILSSKIDPSWNAINYISICKLNLALDFG
jgi:hypothetical protein